MKSIELTMYRNLMKKPILYECQEELYSLVTRVYVELEDMDSDLMTPLKDCVMEQLHEELRGR